jgi:hypothetical protein
VERGLVVDAQRHGPAAGRVGKRVSRDRGGVVGEEAVTSTNAAHFAAVRRGAIGQMPGDQKTRSETKPLRRAGSTTREKAEEDRKMALRDGCVLLATYTLLGMYANGRLWREGRPELFVSSLLDQLEFTPPSLLPKLGQRS